MNIEEKEALALLTRSEKRNVTNVSIKLTIQKHTALIFKEQAIVKDKGLRENGLSLNLLLNITY
jgi:hypothetical protein